MKWKIYYGDGTTFSDMDGSPQEAPCLGVQIIVVADPKLGTPEEVGVQYLQRKDFYWWRDGRWHGSDLFGAWDHLARNGDNLKFGRTIADKTFEEVRVRAEADQDFPKKSAWHIGERPDPVESA